MRSPQRANVGDALAGVCKRAVQRPVRCANQRQQFGRPEGNSEVVVGLDAGNGVGNLGRVCDGLDNEPVQREVRVLTVENCQRLVVPTRVDVNETQDILGPGAAHTQFE